MSKDREWIFDLKAISKARTKLKIQQPVKLRAYRFKDYFGDQAYMDSYHRVRIARGLDIKSANQTIWHELTHCQQLERDFDCDENAFNRFYFDEMFELGCFKRPDEFTPTVLPGEPGYQKWLKKYFEHPMEKEALKNERCLAWRYLLVKPSFA